MQMRKLNLVCTGNETLSTLYSAALMILPVPNNWCTRNLWILSECCLATGTPTIFWTVAFSNSYTENTVSRNNVVHRLNPLPLFSVKDRQALLNRFNVVYKLTCSCGASYIGQTQRNLINRIEEHRTSLSSALCRHLQANPDHRVDFHNPEVIGSDSNGRRLQILESLLIQEHKPELNANIPSMPLCIFNL